MTYGHVYLVNTQTIDTSLIPEKFFYYMALRLMWIPANRKQWEGFVSI